MRLYKAIKYDGERDMTSSFNEKYKFHSCWEDLIITAFSHIARGEHKKEKDYWISASKSFSYALKYLDKSEKYNGIAVIDLPNTLATGKIYDVNLGKMVILIKI